MYGLSFPDELNRIFRADGGQNVIDGFQDPFEILFGNLRPAIIVEYPLTLIPYPDPTQKVVFELNLPLFQVVPFLEKVFS